MQGLDAWREVLHTAEVLHDRQGEISSVSSNIVTTNSNKPTYHQQAIVPQRVAGNGGEVVVVAYNAAAVALPSSVAAHQAEVPARGHSIGAAGQPPQGDVDGRPQDTWRHAL